MIAFAVLASFVLLALGYAAGRLRPWKRFGMWAEDLLRPHHHKRWLGSRTREWALFAALAVTRPGAALGAWRKRRTTEAS
ncbi:hypothetical protein [Streptomyces mutabilis]|uniref:Uncharacterized protein n=1 Tax=Streptomyces mutabilis TaxID=67332 RepID=A0A086MR10_9ACTN|nr:hypothetical protein [Streptomyces mutabilis]KFG71328.1 hypothetical protein FM21_34015 [Streptomyces mutabilis]